MRRLMLPISLLMLCWSTAHTQTIVSGNVTGTWTFANGPYIVSGDVNVVDSLVILPGVIVQFDAGGLSIRAAAGAKLIAKGTADSLIVFEALTTQNPGAWNAIVLTNSGSDDTLEYCSIQSAHNGLYIYSCGGAVNSTINRCTFFNNAESGIFIQAGVGQASATVLDSRIYDNQGNGVFVGSVRGSCTNYCSSTLASITMLGCTIDRNGRGGVQVQGDGAICGNSAQFVAQAQLWNCTITRNDGSGIYAVDSYAGGHASATLRNSIVAYNGYNGINNSGHVQTSEVTHDCFWGNVSGNFLNLSGSGFGQNGNYSNANGDSCDVNYNIFNDPLFADIANGDFRLELCSKAIDAGTPVILGQFVLDPDGSRPEIGANMFDHMDPVIPRLHVDSTHLFLGEVDLGSNSSKIFAVSNTGFLPLRITSFLSSDSAFSITPSSAIIDTGDTQSFQVTFTPVGIDSSTARLEIFHNARCVSDTIMLTGVGIAPLFAFDQDYLDFDTVMAGGSATDSVRVFNSGNAELNISQLSISDSSFSVTPESLRIAPGDTAAFYVTFTPNVNGQSSGAIVFSHNAPNSADTLWMVGVGVGITDIPNAHTGLPTRFTLNQNYPNPFNPSTRIEYALPVQGFVSLRIFDALGREVATLVNEVKNAGYHEVPFYGSKLSSGIYFYRLQVRGFVDTKKFLLLR